MDYDPRLLACAKIALSELNKQPFDNEHPQNIVVRARLENQDRLDALLCKSGMILQVSRKFELVFNAFLLALQIPLLHLSSRQRTI